MASDSTRNAATKGTETVPLQNRVDPFGAIHAVPGRGLFTGNRGVIHDPDTRRLLARRWSTRAWIICDCGFKGRKRDVMGRNAPGGGAGWTNLFFLDEVTALAAGHRPCFYCRRERAREFADCMARGLGVSALKAPEMDRRLHDERLASGGKPRPIAPGEFGYLPDGAMVAAKDVACAVRDGRLLAWGFGGYSAPHPPPRDEALVLVTPPATIAALRSGYVPAWHGSASSA